MEPNTLDRYLVNCFIDRASEEHGVPRQDLLNTWYSMNGSFSLSKVLEESDENSNGDCSCDEEFYVKETSFSYDMVYGCETERDVDKRIKIAHDIKGAIEIFMSKSYPEYMISTISLFEDRNYEIDIQDYDVIFYIHGPEHEINSIVIQLDDIVKNLYVVKDNDVVYQHHTKKPTYLSSLSKIFFIGSN